MNCLIAWKKLLAQCLMATCATSALAFLVFSCTHTMLWPRVKPSQSFKRTTFKTEILFRKITLRPMWLVPNNFCPEYLIVTPVGSSSFCIGASKRGYVRYCVLCPYAVFCVYQDRRWVYPLIIQVNRGRDSTLPTWPCVTLNLALALHFHEIGYDTDGHKLSSICQCDIKMLKIL